jgi:hypothetical protein
MVRVNSSKQGPVGCLVQWVRTAANGASYGVGIKFDDTQENMAASWLKDTLFQLGFEPGKLKERRMFIRFPSPAQIRAVLSTRTGEAMTDGRLMNIGVGGALITVGAEVPLGTKVRLSLDPTLDTPALDTTCHVKSSVRDQKRQVYVTGLQFEFSGEGQIRTYIKAVKKKLARM